MTGRLIRQRRAVSAAVGGIRVAAATAAFGVVLVVVRLDQLRPLVTIRLRRVEL